MIRVMTRSSDCEALKNWSCPPPYIMNEELRCPATERSLFKDWPAGVEGEGRLDRDGEELLFKQLHYCGYRLRQLYKAAHRRGPRISLKRRYNEWGERYRLIRARLIESNLGLVYDSIRRNRFGILDPDEMSSEGMMALLRAADTFDPWRGYHFSTYACNAITRAFSRCALHESKRRGKICGAFDVEFEPADIPARRHASQGALFAERLHQALQASDSTLTEAEKVVLARRFPLEEDRKRQTLEDVGAQMDLSKERVRQIQLSAIAKLRGIMLRDKVLL
jgi:RNA polymerase primary sigma factor